MDEQNFHRHFSQLPDEELLEVIEVERATYQPEAVEVAEAIAQRRGLTFVRPDPSDQAQSREPVGVSGWLLALAVFLVVSQSVAFVLVLGSAPPPSAAAIVLLHVYGIVAGVLLWRGRRGAAGHTRNALLLLTFLYALRLSVATITFGVCLAYLYRSKQVANTFPEFEGRRISDREQD